MEKNSTQRIIGWYGLFLFMYSGLLGIAHFIWPIHHWGQAKLSHFNLGNVVCHGSWLSGMIYILNAVLCIIRYWRERSQPPNRTLNGFLWIAGAILLAIISCFEVTRLPVTVGWWPITGLSGENSSFILHLILNPLSLTIYGSALIILYCFWLYKKCADSEKTVIFLLMGLSIVTVAVNFLPLNEYFSVSNLILWFIRKELLLISGICLLIILLRFVFSEFQPIEAMGINHGLSESKVKMKTVLDKNKSYLTGDDTFSFLNRSLVINGAVLVLIVILLGALHIILYRFRVCGVSWFNMDMERNIPTWFSGSLFFLLGVLNIFVFHVERHIKHNHAKIFRSAFIWVSMGILIILMSLDEISTLHENLYWFEIRCTTHNLGSFWVYVTQWQLLWAPLIFLIFCYFVLFFVHRLRIYKPALITAMAGTGTWLLSLIIEGSRAYIKVIGENAYKFSVLMEEELEIIGIILLMAALILYLRNIVFQQSLYELDKYQRNNRFFSTTTLYALIGLICVWMIGAGIILFCAQKTKEAGQPLPWLHRRMLRIKARERRKKFRSELIKNKINVAPVKMRQ